VEDDSLLIDIYTTRFQEMGFEITVVERGEKAVEKIRKEKPALVILDIVLPHQDGWEILRTLKTDKELEGIQIIILSNLGQKKEVEKGLRLGAARYLIKAHHTPTQVVKEVLRIIEKSK
ncbi:response regulator, partial [Patescibacteria group bacterium]|nr:response regulator [Patescibacteria group bacterium]